MAEVRYLGKLREITGVAQEWVEGSQVGQLLGRLSKKHGPHLGELLFANGNAAELSQDVEVLVNGRDIEFLDGLGTDLGEKDRVTILYHGIRGFPGG
ncbi:MAG: MoaD/ThiS family protein [Dehalococcoidia bacterium]